MTYQTDVKKVIDIFIRGVREGLERDGKVVLSGLGTFHLKTRPPIKGRNPKTGEEVLVPPRKYVKFIPSEEWEYHLRDL